jgi:hypothetical protein
LQTVEKSTILEKILIEQGEIKLNTKTQNNQGITNDKTKFWSRNKNVTNDRVVDAKTTNFAPLLMLRGPNVTNTLNQIANVLQYN